MIKKALSQAMDDYKKARRKADLQLLLARITGKEQEIQLLPYETIRQQFRGVAISREFLEDIPLDAIIGSVGRYRDFTREFLPKRSTSQDRWARVMAETESLTGLPPIEVYKIGQAYFVKDGNHRVSVARQMGNETIQAYVTEVNTRVSLTAEDQPDDLIIKAEYAEFLEETRLDQLQPDQDLSATKAGAYPTILEHIDVHRYYMGLERESFVSYQEAVQHWYDHVYLPIVRIIRERDILRDFPNRTETDLYLWLANHRAELEQELGWDVGPEAAAEDLTLRYSELTSHVIDRFLKKLSRVLTPDILEEGPPAGTWRRKREHEAPPDHLFQDLLVAVDRSPQACHALHQAKILASKEGSSLHGIHVRTRTSGSFDQLDQLLHDLRARCPGLTGQADLLDGVEFQLTPGPIYQALSNHARYADLMILPLNYPPGDQPFARMGSGLKTLIRRISRPILTVPGSVSSLQHHLLAYDGSPKSREALYLSAYFATRWKASLKVVTSQQGLPEAASIQHQAEEYLRARGIQAAYYLTRDPLAEKVEHLVEQGEADLVLIGGYGSAPLIDFVLGSVVDRVMHKVYCPLLICR